MAREYTSAVREHRVAANRDAVLAAATGMFTERGWVATTMADVATSANLTRQTVYQQFDGKLALLDACIVRALAGSGGAPVRDQPGYRAMADGDRAARIRAAAHWLRAAHERSAAIQSVLDQAAVTDGTAADRLAERERTRWAEVANAAGLILGEHPADEVVDALWVLASRRWWLLLVGERGWPPERWERWFEQGTVAALTM